MFDLLFRLLATYRAVRCPGSSAAPDITFRLAKKIGRRFLFGASRLRNLPPGQVPRKKNNRTHHATRLQKNRTELGGRLFSVLQLTDRSGATQEEHASTFPDTRGPRPEQSRAKQKHEPRRKRKVIRGHTRDDAPQVLKRRAWKWTERDRAPTSDGATCDQGRAPHGNRTRARVKAARLKGRVTRRRMKGVRHLPGLATCLQQVASARNRRRQSGDART